jgi:clan AA aspartic protease
MVEKVSFVRVVAAIGKDQESLREVTFLVDTGAFYTMLPPQVASDLAIQTPLSAPVRVADNRVVQIRQGVAYLKVLNREGGIQIGVMDVPEPLLGVTALEALGLKVNPVDETLEYARPYGPAALMESPVE